MSKTVYRSLKPEEYAKLEQAAMRFIKRHDLPIPIPVGSLQSPYYLLEEYLNQLNEQPKSAELKKLWNRYIKIALHDKTARSVCYDTIAYIEQD